MEVNSNKKLVYHDTSVVEDGCGGQLRNLAAVMDDCGGRVSNLGPLFVIRCKVCLFLFGEWGVWGVVVLLCLWAILLLFVLLKKGNSIHGQTKRGSPHQLDPFGRIMNTLPKSERLEPNNSGGNDFLQSFRLHAFDPDSCGRVAVKDCTCHSSGFRLCILGAWSNPLAISVTPFKLLGPNKCL